MATLNKDTTHQLYTACQKVVASAMLLPLLTEQIQIAVEKFTALEKVVPQVVVVFTRTFKRTEMEVFKAALSLQQNEGFYEGTTIHLAFLTTETQKDVKFFAFDMSMRGLR